MKRLLWLFLPVLARAGLIDGTITVTKATGTAELLGPPPKSIGLAAQFPPNSRLGTGADSSYEVFLSNGTKLIVNKDAVVFFKTLKQMEGSVLPVPADGNPVKENDASVTEIEVEKGKVVGDVKKLDKQSAFTLKTPVGTVRIKGTVFAVEIVPNKDGTFQFNVACAKGLVQVEVPGMKGGALSIKPGQQLTMKAPALQPMANQPAMPPPAKKEEGGDKKEGDKAADAPEMKVEPMKAGLIPVNLPGHAPGELTPPPPGPPPSAPNTPSAMDNIIQNIQNTVNREQLNPSPTGG
jgi:hypothetical protein